MRDDLKRAVALVRDGYSYGQAAKLVGGLTRNAVAGACTRAKLRTGRVSGDGSLAAEAVALYLDGTPLSKIARRFGWSKPSHIYNHLQRAGVRSNRYSKPRDK